MFVVGGQPKIQANPNHKAIKHIDRTFLVSDYYQLTLMSAFKRFMIVDDSCRNYAMRSRC